MVGGAESLNFSGSYRATVTVYLTLNFIFVMVFTLLGCFTVLNGSYKYSGTAYLTHLSRVKKSTWKHQ